jgi:pimeloyl-ACP methyl ester carboxylesterase
MPISRASDFPLRRGPIFARALLVLPILFGVPRQEPIQWEPATLRSLSGDTLAADTGRVEVPESRTGRSNAKIRLAVMRVRSTAARPGAPVIYLAGGPGNSGFNGARGEIFPVIKALRERGDVIIYDQRGTGSTLPSLVIRAPLGAPLDEPLMSDRSRAAMLSAARAAAADIKSRGVDLPSYNTVENADDLDALRAALGAEKIVVWGHSYGSHLAFAYARRHGAHIERLIVGGINGLDQRRRLPHDGDVFLARVDSAVRQSPAMSAAIPDFLGAVKRVFAKLDASPVTVRVDSTDVRLGREEVQILIALAGGEQGFVRALPALIAELDAGRYETVAKQVRDIVKRRPMGTAMTFSMDMASGVSRERAARITQEARTAILGNMINVPFDDPEYAAAWGVVVLPDSYRAPLVSDLPTLFISGSLDLRTSITDAEDVRRGFKNSGHVIVDGASHVPYAISAELRVEIVRFVAGAAPQNKHVSVPVEWRR